MFKTFLIVLGLSCLSVPASAGIMVKCQSSEGALPMFNNGSRPWHQLRKRSQNKLLYGSKGWKVVVRKDGTRMRCKVAMVFGESPKAPSKAESSDSAKSPRTKRTRKFRPSPTPAKTAPKLPRSKATLRERMELYAPYIEEASKKYTLPATFIKAVIRVESNFSYRAKSGAGAMGLMQLMPVTARAMGVKDPYDPRQNIMGGSLFLRKLANKYKGDIVKVLSSYNAGPGALAKKDGTIPYLGTEKYVRAVLNWYYQYRAEANL